MEDVFEYAPDPLEIELTKTCPVEPYDTAMLYLDDKCLNISPFLKSGDNVALFGEYLLGKLKDVQKAKEVTVRQGNKLICTWKINSIKGRDLDRLVYISFFSKDCPREDFVERK